MNRSSFLRRSLAAVAAVALPRAASSNSGAEVFTAPSVAPVAAMPSGAWTNGPTSFSYLWQRLRPGGRWDDVGTDACYVIGGADEGCTLRASASAPNY